MEHVEVLRAMLDDAAIEPPWKPEEVAAITAAIASLSAQQPPAEAHPVAWLSDWKHAANGGVTRDADIAAAWEARGEVTPLYTAPPSAPVGVEGHYHPCTSILIEGLKRLEGGSDVLEEWDRARVKVDTALAQQPAAVDEDDFDCPHSAFDNCDCYADQQGGES